MVPLMDGHLTDILILQPHHGLVLLGRHRPDERRWLHHLPPDRVPTLRGRQRPQGRSRQASGSFYRIVELRQAPQLPRRDFDSMVLGPPCW
jgi:hypothetical protein